LSGRSRVTVTFKDKLVAYANICRFEYLPGEIPAVLVVLFLGTNTFARFFAVEVMEALVVFMLLYFTGFIINALADQEIDSKYDTFKTGISRGVDVLGPSTLKWMIFLKVTAAVLITVHISYMMADFVPLALTLVGLFFGLGYSIKPFRFKERGVWHAISLAPSCFFIPFAFLIYVIGAGMSWPLVILMVGFTLVHYGMEFGNQAIDYIEDKEHGVLTPPVRWGMETSLRVAVWMFVLGIFVELPALYVVLGEKGVFTTLGAWFSMPIVFAFSAALLLAGYVYPFRNLVRMHKLSKSTPVRDAMPAYKKLCKYSKWQASGILGMTFVATVIFASQAFIPAMMVGSPSGQILTPAPMGQSFFATAPDVEFSLNPDDIPLAIVNVSIGCTGGVLLEDQAAVRVETWVIDQPYRETLILLDHEMQSGDQWNFEVELEAHDEDDTAVRVVLLQEDEDNVLQEVNVRRVASAKDFYIYEAQSFKYEEGLLNDRKADVTVEVYNLHGLKQKDTAQLVVKAYTLAGTEIDDQTIDLNRTLDGKEMWTETITMDLPEWTWEVYFEVELIYGNTAEPYDTTTVS